MEHNPNHFKGEFQLDEDGTCISRKCLRCEIVKPAQEFSKVPPKINKLGVNSRCKVCVRESQNLLRNTPEHKEKMKRYNQEYVVKNAEVLYEKRKRKYHNRSQEKREKDKIEKAIYSRKRQALIKAGKISRYIIPKEKRNMYAKRYVSSKRTSSPPWLTKEHYDCFDFLAILASLMKSEHTRYALDHIIPLRGKNVCGLHVPWNIQILSSSENNKKNNRFDGTYDNESWRAYV